ncbi:MAG: hypothetical protein A4E72_02043 [Syntrophus sp. PtaU1.Bin208]|nr:MAG: hypothetical protein A4E72_02043 [Syntrophus sp. PtaU1.Bin208]
MAAPKASLILPVENQVRELDAKVLLSCVAAERGFSCILGAWRELDFQIASFPPSLYLSKGLASGHTKMFYIMRKLGHEIGAWDEEALVHMEPATYYSVRLSSAALQYVSHLFAWGDENAELWRRYPDLPRNIPIHVTGNPRGDLLRPEMSGYFAREAEELRRAYGEFILVNTNFGEVNAFYPNQDILRSAMVTNRTFAEGLRAYKKAIFEDFKQLIPALDKAFPRCSIVIRPHPSENHLVYQEIASRCERVQVTSEGNVVPWLKAARVLVHNGCTTAIEAYLMGVPAVSYQVTVNESYEREFYRLPNFLSHQCFNDRDFEDTLDRILYGELGPARGEERRALMGHFLASREGPLASRRIVETLENIVNDPSGFGRSTLTSRWHGRYLVTKRRVKKKLDSYRPESKYRPEFQRHRYPGVSLEEMREKVARFQDLLGAKKKLDVEQYSRDIFRIYP